MTLKEISPELASELLIFLAENESFESLKAFKDISPKEAKKLLRELAERISAENLEDHSGDKPQYSELNLSQKSMALISCLSPREEMLLFKSFKIL